jgi:hypothetical protein
MTNGDQTHTSVWVNGVMTKVYQWDPETHTHRLIVPHIEQLLTFDILQLIRKQYTREVGEEHGNNRRR